MRSQRKWIFLPTDDLIRMIMPALARRRVSRGRKYGRVPPPGHSEIFLIAHGYTPDEHVDQHTLAFCWNEPRQFELVSKAA
jgi:hypothetical protein